MQPQTTFANGRNPFLPADLEEKVTPLTGVRGPASIETITKLLKKNDPLTCKQICTLLRTTTRNARTLLGQLKDSGQLVQEHHDAVNGNYAYFTYTLRDDDE